MVQISTATLNRSNYPPLYYNKERSGGITHFLYFCLCFFCIIVSSIIMVVVFEIDGGGGVSCGCKVGGRVLYRFLI